MLFIDSVPLPRQIPFSLYKSTGLTWSSSHGDVSMMSKIVCSKLKTNEQEEHTVPLTIQTISVPLNQVNVKKFKYFLGNHYVL